MSSQLRIAPRTPVDLGARACSLSRTLVGVVVGAGSLMLAGCATLHYDVNAPLSVDRPKARYVTRSLTADRNGGQLNLVMTLSGGGYRAAAMGYAALEVLRDTPLGSSGESGTLLQELDVVSAVSGGSLAAAYYARDPSRFFAEFPSRVLAFDLQGVLLARALSPRGLWRQTSPTWGRGDLLQEVLDEQVFHGLTYGDLPRRRPMVLINATDMRLGDRFEFSQDQFDQLCSDLDRLPLARAVAASMAVPILLSPITLWNHRDHCPAGVGPLPAPGRSAESRYIHLIDGGLADNTGVRAPIENVAAHGGLARSTRLAGLPDVRRLVIIVVNAQVDPRHPDDDSPRTPGLLRQLRSAVDLPIDRQSASNLRALTDSVRQWQLEAHSASAATEIHVIEVSVATARNRAAAEVVRNIPTGLSLTPEQFEQIRRFVRDELSQHPAWLRLMDGLRQGGEHTEQAAATAP
jgi:NTE family protein